MSLIVQTVLVLHNGQAEVERGFSINKYIMEDNMSELSLLSRRLVKDYLRSNSLESHEVDICSGMVSAVQQSSSQYLLFLKEKKEKEQTEAVSKKKNAIRHELNVYKKEKELKEKTFKTLNAEAYAAYHQASGLTEQSEIMVLLAKGKGLHEKAEIFKGELAELQKKIEKTKLKLESKEY